MIQISIPFFLEVKKKCSLGKVKVLWEDHKIWKKVFLCTCFEIYSVTSKQEGDLVETQYFLKNIEELHDWKVNVKFKGRQFSN